MVIFIILYLSFKLNSDEIEKIEKSHVDVIGEISTVGYKTVKISYKVNGVLYSYVMGKPYKNLIVGEQFPVMAYTKDFSRAIVKYESPFIDSNKYQFKQTVATKKNRLIENRREISFSYIVNGETINRIQKYKFRTPDPITQSFIFFAERKCG